jgi:replication fork clamp-binding protein CrfC
MTEDISPDEKTILDETLQRLRNQDRHPVPSYKVKQFLQIIGDELQRTGELKKQFVDQVVQQLKSGEL